MLNNSASVRWKFVFPGLALIAALIALISLLLLNHLSDDSLARNGHDAPQKPPAADSGGDPGPHGDMLDTNMTMFYEHTGPNRAGLEFRDGQIMKPGLDPELEGDGVNYDIQSPARPFGLDILSPVQMAGSDEASADFMENTLPDILDYIKSNVVDSSEVELISAEAKSSNLSLSDPASVRVYFVGEEAGYHNSLGVNFAGDEGSMLVFPDASSAASFYPEDGIMHEYTSEEYPLMPGDFIDIGSVEEGSILDFFIIPDGARNASEAYGIDRELNSDQTVHARVLGVVDNSVVVLGFEDITHGGDRDYDDVIIAVDVGANNVQSISSNFGQ